MTPRTATVLFVVLLVVALGAVAVLVLWSPSPEVTDGAFVVLLVAPVACGLLLAAAHGVEAVAGATALTLAVLTVPLVVWLAVGTPPPLADAHRFLLAVGLLALMLVGVAVEWSRGPLRLLGVVGLLAVGLLLVDVGRASLRLQEATDALTTLTQVETAMKSLPEQEPEPSTADLVEDAVAAACATARATAPGAAGPTCDAEPTGEGLASQLAMVQLRLAEHRQAVLTRDDDDAAVAAAREALADARAAEFSTPDEVPVATAVAAGADAVLNDALPGDDGPPVAFGTAAWILLAAAAVLAWTRIERVSTSQDLGPVTIELTSTSPSDSEEHARQREAFRVSVLRNISEPRAVPGSSKGPVADLSETVATGIPWLQAVLTLLQRSLNAPTGYRALVDVAPLGPTPPQWTAMARVVDATNGAQLGVKAIFADDAVSACCIAGYWAAASLIGQSSRVPSWNRFTETTAEALAAWMQGSGDTVEALERAVARAPSSGVLLVQLANAYELAGRRTDALELYARAVAAHPTYLAAVYRLTVAVTMLALEREDQATWSTLAPRDRLRIGRQVRAACRQLGVPDGTSAFLTAPRTAPATWYGCFWALSQALYARLGRRQAWWAAGVRLLRRSERPTLWARGADGVSRTERLRRARWVTRAGRLLTAGPAPSARTRARAAASAPSGPELRRVAHEADDHRSWWQTSYNLACYYARRGDSGKALAYLETALSRRGSEQMAGGWLAADPDLVSLRSEPGFVRIRQALTAGAGGSGHA
ncbi:TPR end-of-group domain-containing protein [Cellulomonas wangsupingiae]|uniref:TPR end-of-group domain-containing protein n=1 Tax=Cellulomonas wangsupingiae TaxID=2968085 RepID=UPI001D0EBBF0|nr:hypothetical protein [Cellulomonas wangsupingiae]MCM0639380.1 hypothetical protein [Cellulomonas wangsupingiae]